MSCLCGVIWERCAIALRVYLMAGHCLTIFPLQVVHEEFLLGKSIQGARVYLYPHLHFSIGFNDDQIVSANVTTDSKRRVDITDVTSGQEIVFSYTVEWVHTPEIKYQNRMKRYADNT